MEIKVKTVIWGFISIVVVIALCQYLGFKDMLLELIDNREQLVPGK